MDPGGCCLPSLDCGERSPHTHCLVTWPYLTEILQLALKAFTLVTLRAELEAHVHHGFSPGAPAQATPSIRIPADGPGTRRSCKPFQANLCLPGRLPVRLSPPAAWTLAELLQVLGGLTAPHVPSLAAVLEWSF